jgi:exodeoxyribonuclease VII small subunit
MASREAEQPATSTSFEAARDELASVVQRLESGGLSLEEALALWQRGEDLGRICQEWLDAATATLDASNTQT